MEQFDPVVEPMFKITKKDKIATAGSCFAQNIAAHLRTSGYCYYVTEPGPTLLPATVRQENGYGVFSARYGNLYTTRQLLQTFDRAFGTFSPKEVAWESDGVFFDPFRPHVQHAGFVSEEELLTDRSQHLGAVRTLFETLDVFIFTLGLTEAWLARSDGAVFPVCPGCGTGTFSEDNYRFHNFRYPEVQQDLSTFLARLRSVNETAKVILTVSPVPLVATAEPRHVAVSTTYSKSVLRAVAGDIAAEHENVVYFPSYEIIASHFMGNRYYAQDQRNVTQRGVSHVMQRFFEHFCGVTSDLAVEASEESVQTMAATSAEDEVAQAICDEEMLDADRSNQEA